MEEFLTYDSGGNDQERFDFLDIVTVLFISTFWSLPMLLDLSDCVCLKLFRLLFSGNDESERRWGCGWDNPRDSTWWRKVSRVEAGEEDMKKNLTRVKTTFVSLVWTTRIQSVFEKHAKRQLAWLSWFLSLRAPPPPPASAASSLISALVPTKYGSSSSVWALGDRTSPKKIFPPSLAVGIGNTEEAMAAAILLQMSSHGGVTGGLKHFLCLVVLLISQNTVPVGGNYHPSFFFCRTGPRIPTFVAGGESIVSPTKGAVVDDWSWL